MESEAEIAARIRSFSRLVILFLESFFKLLFYFFIALQAVIIFTVYTSHRLECLSWQNYPLSWMTTVETVA